MKQDTMYHITPIENLEEILAIGLYPSEAFEGFGVFMATEPLNCYLMLFDRFIGGAVFGALFDYHIRGKLPTPDEKIYALLKVNTKGYELKETENSRQFREYYYSERIPKERLTYVGNINTAERTITLADGKVSLDTYEVIEKW